MSQKNPVDTKRPLYSIFRYAALHNKKLTIGLVLAILISVTVSVTPPLILRRIVDELTAENAMLPFLIQPGDLPFKNLDYLFVPGIKKAVEDKAEEIKAYVVTSGEGMKEFSLKLGELTDEERQIILKGCLINYNRV